MHRQGWIQAAIWTTVVCDKRVAIKRRVSHQVDDVIQRQQLINGSSAGDEADEVAANIWLDLLDAVGDDAVQDGIAPGRLFPTLQRMDTSSLLLSLTSALFASTWRCSWEDIIVSCPFSFFYPPRTCLECRGSAIL